MKISESEFDWLAGLSGLSFDDSEKAEFMQDFEGIVAFADEIRELAAEEANLMEEKPQQNDTIKTKKTQKDGTETEEIPRKDCEESFHRKKNGKEGLERILDFSELREDMVKESLPVEEILSDRDDKDGYFSVKQVKLT